MSNTIAIKISTVEANYLAIIVIVKTGKNKSILGYFD